MEIFWKLFRKFNWKFSTQFRLKLQQNVRLVFQFSWRRAHKSHKSQKNHLKLASQWNHSYEVCGFVVEIKENPTCLSKNCVSVCVSEEKGRWAHTQLLHQSCRTTHRRLCSLELPSMLEPNRILPNITAYSVCLSGDFLAKHTWMPKSQDHSLYTDSRVLQQGSFCPY